MTQKSCAVGMRNAILRNHLNVLKIYTKQTQRKVFVYKKKLILRLTFMPRLALTSFRTTRTCLQVILTRVPRFNPKTRIWSAINFKKHVSSMSFKLNPAIQSRDTGQRILCFDRCQLTITWLFNIKEGRYKPRVHVCQPVSWSMAAMLCDSSVVVVRTRPRAIPLTKLDNQEKINSWVSFLFLSEGKMIQSRGKIATIPTKSGIILYMRPIGKC